MARQGKAHKQAKVRKHWDWRFFSNFSSIVTHESTICIYVHSIFSFVYAGGEERRRKGVIQSINQAVNQSIICACIASYCCLQPPWRAHSFIHSFVEILLMQNPPQSLSCWYRLNYCYCCCCCCEQKDTPLPFAYIHSVRRLSLLFSPNSPFCRRLDGFLLFLYLFPIFAGEKLTIRKDFYKKQYRCIEPSA